MKISLSASLATGREKIRRENGFVRLFISERLLRGASSAMMGLFVPIFIYQITGEHFYIVGMFYAVVSLLYALLLVPAMRLTNRVGFSRALAIGGAFNVLLYTLLIFMNASNFWYLLPWVTVAALGFRLWHWVPYHTDFSLFTRTGERGRMVSLSMATMAFLGMVGPILAGYIIHTSGYGALFTVGMLLLVAAAFSYLAVPETGSQFTWSYRETLVKMVSRKYAGLSLGEAANGIEVGVTLIVWPIFLYEILHGNVFQIGAVSTLIVGATIVMQLMLGRYLDAKVGNHEKTLRVGSAFYAAGWIFKIFVLSAAQVFFVALYHNVMKIFTKTPYSAILYDMSAEQGEYIDEFTVIKEMSNQFGRCISLCIIVYLSFFVPISWTFVIAAVASLALNMIYRLSVNPKAV